MRMQTYVFFSVGQRDEDSLADAMSPTLFSYDVSVLDISGWQVQKVSVLSPGHGYLNAGWQH